MAARPLLPALTLTLLVSTGLLALTRIGALLWLGLPWLVLGLLLAAPALILTITEEQRTGTAPRGPPPTITPPEDGHDAPRALMLEQDPAHGGA